MQRIIKINQLTDYELMCFISSDEIKYMSNAYDYCEYPEGEHIDCGDGVSSPLVDYFTDEQYLAPLATFTGIAYGVIMNESYRDNYENDDSYSSQQAIAMLSTTYGPHLVDLDYNALKEHESVIDEFIKVDAYSDQNGKVVALFYSNKQG